MKRHERYTAISLVKYSSVSLTFHSFNHMTRSSLSIINIKNSVFTLFLKPILKIIRSTFFDILLLMLGVMVKRFPLVPLHQAELKNAYL